MQTPLLVTRCSRAPSTVRIHLGLLGAIAALGACSDEPPAAPSSGGFDLAAVRACDLLMPSEIEAATGVAVGDGADMSQAGGRLPICNWPRAGSETDVAVTLLVSSGGYSTYQEFLESARDNAFGDFTSGAELEEVAGIGDFGVWMRDGLMLQVYAGDVMVQVDATAAAGRDELEASKTLAAAALARLC